MKLTELFETRVHRVGNPPVPRGAPEVKARAFDTKITDRSVLKQLEKSKKDSVQYFTTGDATSDEDSFSVLVMSTEDRPSTYPGISVRFMRDGTIELDTFEKFGDQEAKKDKEKIIRAAKKDFQKAINKHISGKVVGDYTTLPRFGK